MAIRTMPRQLKFGSLLRLLSRWELRSGCAIGLVRGNTALEKLHQRVGNAISRSHALVCFDTDSGLAFDWDVRLRHMVPFAPDAPTHRRAERRGGEASRVGDGGLSKLVSSMIFGEVLRLRSE